MKTIFPTIRLVVILMLISCLKFYPQENIRIIKLSDSIGPVVDKNEKARYNILPVFQDNFVFAIFYVSQDSNYLCYINYQDDNLLTDTTFILSYISIKNISYKIAFWDCEQKNQPSPSLINFKLKYASSKEVKNEIHNFDFVKRGKTAPKINTNLITAKDVSKSIKKLPVSQRPIYNTNLPTNRLDLNYDKLLERKVRLGISFGLMFSSKNYNKLDKIFNLLEEQIPAEFNLSNSRKTFERSPNVKISTLLLIKEKIRFEFEYDFNTPSNDEDKLGYRAAVLSFSYNLINFKNIIWYSSLGYIRNEINAFYSYDLQLDNSNTTLESISLKGNSNGIRLSSGILFTLSPSVNLDIRLSFNYLSSIRVYDGRYNLTNTPKINMSNLEFGISINFTN